MQKNLGFVILLALGCANARALDGFERVQCGSDVRAALVGQRMSNEPVAAIEARHAALGLKNLGGDDVSDRLFSAGWSICGMEFQLILDEKAAVRDAVQFPAHSKAMPEFVGRCTLGGKELPETILAVLEDKAGADRLAVSSAWKIDDKTAKFVKLSTEGLRCPRAGIITADGGQ